MQVVIPGNVESMAVSSVQSMKAPLDNRKRLVGKTFARMEAVAVGCRKGSMLLSALVATGPALGEAAVSEPALIDPPANELSAPLTNEPAVMGR
jgi:hypothetical protein